jgi:hypothetical protein
MTTAPANETAPATTGHRVVRSLADRLARLARWPLWLGQAAVYAVFAGLLFGSRAAFAIPHVEAACGQAPPDVRVFTSAADVTGFLTACGAAGRDAYRYLQLADLLYPAVFGLFMATSIALVVSRLAPAHRPLLALAALPLVASAFDYLENLCAWLALAAFPDQSPASLLLGPASAAKNLTSWASGALLLGAVGLLAVRRIRAARATA